ncbi:transposon Tf2-9 polyprotein [Trichonephila clavipes]|nr:transposon Tf2-9 polyprotein [Trichonephila clavipes]
MYKNALKEDLIRVVQDLDDTVESTDTIAKLKTKIKKSSTFERQIIEKAYQYEIGDIVAIQRTQFGTGFKLRPKFFGPYEVAKVKPKDRYDVRKIGLHKGPNTTSTAADHMKSPYLFRLFCMFQILLWSPLKKKELSTAADSVRSGWPLWNRLWSRHQIESINETKHAVFARRRS